MEAIRPYYQQENLCLCPMASILSCDVGLGEVGRTFVAWSECYNWLPEGTYGSYGINGWVEHDQCDNGYQWMDALRWRTPNVLGADKIPLLLDSPWIDAWPRHTNAPPPAEDMHPNSTSNMGRFCISRHDGYINALFLDFSVRKVGLKELWTLKWHRQYDTCGTWTVCGGISPTDWPIWMQDFEDY
jgi:prepilin-type processing-associated H-X9-DG protein